MVGPPGVRLEAFTKAFKVLAGALFISTVAAAKFFVDASFLPENLGALAPATGVVVGLTMIIVWSAHKSASFRKSFWLGIVATIAFLAVLLMNVGFIVVVEQGTEQAAHYLIGYDLTARGDSAAARCGSEGTESLVECAGAHLIPVLWGGSFEVLRFAYAMAYFTFVLFFTAAIAMAVVSDMRPAQPAG